MNKNYYQSIREELIKGKKMAQKIIQNLTDSDISLKLKTLEKLDDLPPLPTDNSTWDLKEFVETKDVYRRLYTLAARSIMEIINANYMHGRHDPAKSFNYVDPTEPLKAAEKIGFLPKAYMGGPIKAAVSSPYLEVNKVAVSFYDVLPQDLKYSQTFPDPIRKKIRSIRKVSTAELPR
ncbi:MAG TPA: hypothetical protein PK926_16145 [Spirochaetota bacterium]|nr:hypothetical protein [Spirochaetota bacterium]HPI90520.1 hypothetical protein [Spirochaetota bacterium]HPR47880.1 hypothetical protein [Spirochaetota bacterium]